MTQKLKTTEELDSAIYTIRTEIRKRGLSISKFSKSVEGKSYQTIYNTLTKVGGRSPRLETLELMLEALGITWGDVSKNQSSFEEYLTRDTPTKKYNRSEDSAYVSLHDLLYISGGATQESKDLYKILDVMGSRTKLKFIAWLQKVKHYQKEK